MRYLSKLGYQIGDDGIDTYGVNHNDFTINDELRYQTARIDRENQLIRGYNNMGIKDNYPLYTTNFWGIGADNNYGFGSSNIQEAISNHSGINQTSLPIQNFNQTQIQANASNFVGNNSSIERLKQNNYYNPINSLYNLGQRIGEEVAIDKIIWDNEGLYGLGKRYAEPSVKRALQAKDNIAPLPISDINKHQFVSCVGSTDGLLATAQTIAGGLGKEFIDTHDKLLNVNKRNAYGGVLGVMKDAGKDFVNDIKGAFRGSGTKNPNECKKLLPENFRNRKYW